jgi:hypothetical protein
MIPGSRKRNRHRESPQENLIMTQPKQLMELRIYTVRPRKMPEFVELFDRLAMPILLETLGNPIGFWTSVVGPLNQFIQLWAYDSLEDYERRFRARENHPDFARYLGAYLAATEPLLVSQETRLIRACDMKSFPLGQPQATP